jgi:hypothetical protein
MYYKVAAWRMTPWRAAGSTPMFENILIFRAAVTDRLKRITSEIVYCAQKTKSQGMGDNCNS